MGVVSPSFWRSLTWCYWPAGQIRLYHSRTACGRSIKSTLTFPLKSGQDKGSISYFLHFLHPLVFKTKGFWSKLHQFWKHTPAKQYTASLSLLQFQNPFNHNPYCQGFWLGLLGLYVWILRNQTIFSQEEMILPWTCCSKRSILV